MWMLLPLRRADALRAGPRPGDVVLIKAAHAVGIQALARHLIEQEQVTALRRA
ncbi:hypothetical protein ACIBF5_31155 [Micromonospora sp. NPDC050417]|uniref:hypothetical protein n=1 Tax=Micromonospora sp. NPDC050417 TaxID=3364280 RepID=UPI0037A63E3D